MSDAEGHNPSHSPPAQGQAPPGGPPPLPKVDVRERGADRDGQPQVMDRRLFMQLLAFRAPRGSDPSGTLQALCRALEDGGIPAVVYEDVNDPRGLALVSWSEDPRLFVEGVRPLFAREALRDLEPRPELTMLGRTYSGGYEDDLTFWLLDRPRQTVLNPEWPWAVWYPLRRVGAFGRLDPKEQSSILREHSVVGRAYGAKDLAHDVRLACHGLDQNDNEFVIGLIGRELHPLSHVVQTMRRTRQTSEFMQHMGPFFVGHAVWRSSASSGTGSVPDQASGRSPGRRPG